MAPKRKRAATLTKQTDEPQLAGQEVSQPLDKIQPSSRDASEEDAHDPILQEVIGAKRDADANHNDDGGSGGPASKRSRQDDDDEEELDALEFGEGGERGKMRMAEVPKAGLVDPVGYKTNPPPVGRPVRIYADGVFDLFHLGHMRQLQQAKQAFPEVYLIVGVTGDKETHRRKGLTVLSGAERAESVRHCKWVDEVVEDCPWIISDHPDFIEKYKIDYIAHDDIPYGADEGDDIYAPIKEAGKFLVTQRTEGVSTTGIITKIVKDYDQYIARQFKRGASRQELNVSWLKKNELDIKRSVAEIRNNIKSNWTTTGQELGKELQRFWQPSRPASPAPGVSRRLSDEMAGKMPLAGPTSPTGHSHLAHLEIPKIANGGPSSSSGSSDFAAGYSLGLIGGVRAWMAKTRKNLNQPGREGDESPDSAEESSPVRSPELRGRPELRVQDQVDAQVQSELSK